MRLFRFFSWSLLLLGFLLPTAPLTAQSTPPFSFTTDPRDTLGRQREQEEQRTLDPALGRVPYERLAEERERVMGQLNNGQSSTQGSIPNMTWQERGPKNTGGRAKAVLFDPNDPARKKVWVGSPQGGLWYINDITDTTATWTNVSDGWENLGVTCLAADPSNPQVMYAGTGDNEPYSIGGGIWKTTNGGTTWTRLSSTIPGGNYGSVSSSFGFIQRIVVNSSGYLFAATRYGVVRSTDGGGSWQLALAPNQAVGVGAVPTNNYYNDLVYSLEIGSDGVLYASFASARLYKTTNAIGSAWRDITPAGVPSGGDRTVLAIAPSTSGSGQVIYAASSAYNSTNYNQDVSWFRKSTDAGTTWSAVSIPAYSTGAHFTNGGGNRSLSITVDATNPAILYAGGYGYDWFRSTTGGDAWSTPLRVANRYTYQYGLVFQPGSAAGALLVNSLGVSWTTGWGTASASTAPTVINKNNGYRASDVQEVLVKPAPATAYLLASIYGTGLATLTKPGLSATGNVLFSTSDYLAQLVIDTDEPTIQLFSYYGLWYQVISNSYQSLFSSDCSSMGINAVAYDSPNNTLYTSDGGCSSSSYSIRRTTGIGGTISYTKFPTSGYASALQLSNDRKSLFVAQNSLLLVKYSNLDQTTPTATTIAKSGDFPSGAVISSVNVGATDNELLVTISSTGVASVWYTNNGGATWTNKDPANGGLPDVPVRTALFNPQNRKQVILGTDLGIWTTNDILADNPGWALSSAGMPLLKINQLRYRPSDGRLVAATSGRGIYETDALAVPYGPSSIALTGISTTSPCAGGALAVSFSTSGPAFAGKGSYELWISDATGNFAGQRRLGTGTGSPVSVTLPSGSSALPYGTAYRLKVVAVDAELTSAASDPLAVGNLGTVSVVDRRGGYNYAYVCTGDQVRLIVSANGSPIDSYQWVKDSTLLAGATSPTYLAGQAGSYKVQVKQGGCSGQSAIYTVYNATSLSSSVISRFGTLPQCDDAPATLVSNYVGEQAALQWTRNGTPVSGATSATYVANQSGNYAVLVTQAGCDSYAYPLAVTLGRSLMAKVRTASGGDSVLCAGTSAGTVYLYADELYSDQLVSGGYSVVWYKNGVPISPLQNSYSLPVTQSGTYSFDLRQGNCQTRSNAVVVRQQATVQPSIDGYNIGKSVCPGDSRTLYLYGGYGSLQWQKDGVDVASATGYSFTAQASGAYTVRATKGGCAGTSAPVSLTFSNALVPEINNQGQGESCINKYLDVNRYTQLSGTRFQWFKNDVPIPGATSASLTTTTTGLYSVSVTSGACAGLSKPVLSTPYTGSKPVITGARDLCTNATVRLSASQVYSSAQWKRNGVALPDQISSSYFPTQSGSYSVYTTNYCGTFESDPVEVKIGEPTGAALTGNALVNAGQTAQLPVTFTGPAPWSFTLSDGQSVSAVTANPYLLTVTPSATTTYSIINLLNACGTGTPTGQAVVTVGNGQADVSMMAQVNNRVPRLGEVVSYSVLVTNMGPQNAGNLRVTSRLPTGLSFAGSTSPDVSFADGVVSGAVPSLLAGYTATLVYQLRVEQPGAFLVAAQLATTDTPDPDSQPNSGTGDGQDDSAVADFQTAEPGGRAVSPNPGQVPLPGVQSSQPISDPNSVELSLGILSSTQVPMAGDVISLSLVVNNRGGATANNTAIQFELPAGWQLINNISGLDVNGQTAKTYLNPIAANTQVMRVVDVQVQKGTNPVRAQILSVTEPVANARPGNGYQNGERDEASLLVVVRN